MTWTWGWVCFGLVVGVGACRKTPETLRPEVTLYCSVDQQVAEPILNHFEASTGIRVKARFDTEASKTVGLVQRLRAERQSPLADVFWSSEVFYTIRLAEEGHFAPYQSERTEQWPEVYADPQGRWYGFALRFRVLAFHTGRVPVAEAPRSLEAVLEPRWRERLVMARPEFGTTGGDVASWFTHYGSTRARAILQGLRDNQIHLVDGNSTAVRWVATGQADVCFTDTDDVYAAQRNGWPVAMFPLDQQGQGALAIPNTAALIQGAPHPELARILMAFLLSDKVEELLAASDSRNIPLMAKTSDNPSSEIDPTPLALRYPAIADHLKIAIRAAQEILP